MSGEVKVKPIQSFLWSPAAPESSILSNSRWHPLSIQPEAVSVYSKPALCLACDGSLHSVSLTEDSPIALHPIALPVRVKLITSCFTVSLLIAEEGQVFSMGSDMKGTGVLGVPGITSITHPLLIPGMIHVIAVSAGVSENHAAVGDNIGHLYTWGTGHYGELGQRKICQKNQSPLRVDSSQINTATAVVCGKGFTCVCTEGGFVYIYGVLGNLHANNKGTLPVNLRKFRFNRERVFQVKAEDENMASCLPELEQLFVSNVYTNGHFVGVLTDMGEIYVFDDCEDLIKLPTVWNKKINNVSMGSDGIFGITEGLKGFYEWRENKQPGVVEQIGCALAGWTGKYYEMNINLKLHNYPYVSCHGNCRELGKLVQELPPCDKAEYARKLIELLDNTPAIVNRKSLLGTSWSSTLTFEEMSMEVLDDSLDSLSCILQRKIEKMQQDQIAKSIHPLISQCMKKCLENMKYYGNAKLISKLTLAVTSIPSVLARTSQRVQVTSLAYAFHCIKDTTQMDYHMTNQGKGYKEDILKSIANVLSGAVFRITLLSFSALKDLELQSLQKTTAIISMDEVVNHIENKILKFRMSSWKVSHQIKQCKIKGIEKLRSVLVSATCGDTFHLFSDLRNMKKAQEESLRRSTSIANRQLRIYTTKPRFDTWKRTVIVSRVELINKKYNTQISLNSLILRIDYALKRAYHIGFSCLIPHSNTKRWKLGLLVLFSCVSRSLTRLKLLSFGEIRETEAAQSKSQKPLLVLKKKLRVSTELQSKNKNLGMHSTQSINIPKTPAQNTVTQSPKSFSSVAERHIAKAAIQAYHEQVVLKYANMTRKSISSPDKHDMNKLNWKSATIVQSKVKQNPAVRRQEYDKSLRARFRCPRLAVTSLKAQATRTTPSLTSLLDTMI